jgi:hypothetical protein
MVSSSVREVWARYLDAERDHIRAQYLPLLDEFIDGLLAEGSLAVNDWALTLVRSIVDEGADIPVRLPLFRRVLFPALSEAVVAGVPGAARWLAHFSNLMFHTDLSSLPEALRNRFGLLQDALRVDVNDVTARRAFVRVQESILEYAIHEVPDGVLDGTDGATVEGCTQLLRILADFKRNVEILGVQDEHVDLIEECELHLNGYRDFLIEPGRHHSYEAFLANRSGV